MRKLKGKFITIAVFFVNERNNVLYERIANPYIWF